MDVEQVIAELTERQLVSDPPERHHAQRRQRETLNARPIAVAWTGETEIGRPIRDPRRLSDRIWLADGDLEPLPQAETAEVDGRLGEGGIDAWAWYRSFHRNPADRWGIYILDRGVHSLARALLEGAMHSRASRSGSVNLLTPPNLPFACCSCTSSSISH